MDELIADLGAPYKIQNNDNRICSELVGLIVLSSTIECIGLVVW